MRLPWRRPKPEPVAYEDVDPLTIVLVAADPAAADSAVLAGHDLTEPVLVRHHLTGLPDLVAVEQARSLLGQDGYRLTVLPGPPYAVRAWRTQILTPMAAAQERSRMAGLSQRLGGDVAGYDVCVPSDVRLPSAPAADR